MNGFKTVLANHVPVPLAIWILPRQGQHGTVSDQVHGPE